jgi:ubiquinone/menaquinone biosynthesis C-methylase UbiE
MIPGMFPSLYDAVLAPLEGLGLRRWRQRVVAPASGQVLEIGAGTGLNLAHYRQATDIVLSEPDRAMLSGARARIARSHWDVHLVAADAEALPFPSGSFDTVVATLVFCTIPHPEAAFAEVRRVLRPGGTLRLLEHVRTPRRWVARLQDSLTPLWKHLANGCHLNRCSLRTAQEQGFLPVNVRTGLDGWLIAAELQRPRFSARTI